MRPPAMRESVNWRKRVPGAEKAPTAYGTPKNSTLIEFTSGKGACFM
jgi:hypothetical protein